MINLQNNSIISACFYFIIQELVGANNIAWIGQGPPRAEPDCGFDGIKCSLPHDPGVLSAAAAVAAAAILAAALMIRHYRYEQKLASVLWRIEAKDLTFISPYNTHRGPDKVLCDVSATLLYQFSPGS